MFHRVEEKQAETDSAHPGLCMPWENTAARNVEWDHDDTFKIFEDKSEYVVAAPQYRAAANTAMGWRNANLRSEMTRLLHRAGVSGWPRLFHSMRTSRQTELQREFPLNVVCSWLGNSPRIVEQFMGEREMEYPTVIDRIDEPIKKAYVALGLRGYPTYFLITPEGEIDWDAVIRQQILETVRDRILRREESASEQVK